MKMVTVVSVFILKKTGEAIIDAIERKKIERSYRSFRNNESFRYVNKRDIPEDHIQGSRTNNCPNYGAIIVNDICPYCNTRLL